MLPSGHRSESCAHLFSSLFLFFSLLFRESQAGLVPFAADARADISYPSGWSVCSLNCQQARCVPSRALELAVSSSNTRTKKKPEGWLQPSALALFSFPHALAHTCFSPFSPPPSSLASFSSLLASSVIILNSTQPFFIYLFIYFNTPQPAPPPPGSRFLLSRHTNSTIPRPSQYHSPHIPPRTSIHHRHRHHHTDPSLKCVTSPLLLAVLAPASAVRALG